MAQTIALSPVETSPAAAQKSTEALTSILHAHHVDHSLLWDMSKFITIPPEHKSLGIHIVHSPHLLASLSLLGATPARLQQVYASESKILLAPKTPTGTITTDNWRSYLGDRQHTREYLDFFERELARLGGDWRALIELYLLSGETPLVKSLTGDLNHPLIHLAYAYELRNAELATDALTYCAVHYDPQTQVYLDGRELSSSLSSTKAKAPTASSPLEVLANIRADNRLDGFPPGPGREHFSPLFKQHGDVVLEHWRSWPPAGAPSTTDLCDAFDACVSILVGTVPDGGKYDFILLHALTGCHALRVMLPELPREFHAPLFNQWWLFTIMVYITQGRPAIDDSLFTNYQLDGKGWSVPVELAIESPAGFDAHYVKAIRAIKTASDLSGQVAGSTSSASHSEEWYLKAATRFAKTFRAYGGFGPADEDMISQLISLTGQGSSERH